MTEHAGLPVSGYRPQSSEAVQTVNGFKAMEEEALRVLDLLRDPEHPLAPDPRWLALGRTHLEQAFMAINRSIFKPERITLEQDQAS